LGQSHGKVDPIVVERLDVPIASPVNRPIGIANTNIGTTRLATTNLSARAIASNSLIKDYSVLSGTQGSKIIMADPNTGEQWITQDLTDKLNKKEENFTKELGLMVGSEVVNFKWKNGAEPDATKIRKELFENRITANDYYKITPAYELTTDFASRLPHLYFYQIPICIGDCYNQLGDYDKALASYLKAAKYQYININFEIPSLWLKIASNYLDWGNSLYKSGEPQDALTQYSQVIKPDDTVPGTAPLYKTELKSYGDLVTNFIGDIENPSASALNPKLKSVVLDIRAKILSIAAGLDFWGYQATYFPIFKFEYLQSVAQ
jgi:tetratricopeptide (TPR) repeat protein